MPQQEPQQPQQQQPQQNNQLIRAYQRFQPYTKATTQLLSEAVRNIPIPQPLQKIGEKEIAFICIAASCALAIEHKLGTPLVSGVPQLLGLFFTNCAYLLDTVANTTDPYGNSAAAYTGLLAATYFIYALCQAEKARPRIKAEAQQDDKQPEATAANAM